MYKDLHDQVVTTKSGRAFDFYMKGLDKFLGLDEDGIDDFQKSIKLDPEFALVYALLANQCLYFDTRKNTSKYLKLAIKYKKKSSQREQSIIRLIELMIDGDSKSIQLALDHIDNYPRDVIVLSFVLGPFGLLAFSGNLNWRQINLDIIQEVSSNYLLNDWWFATTHSFILIENTRYSQAAGMAESAWNMKKNGNCAHTLAHLHYETANYDQGRNFIDEWSNSVGKNSNFSHHLQWHDALCALKLDNKDEVYDICRKLINTKKKTLPLDYLADNTSLLWYCIINNIEVPKSWFIRISTFLEDAFPDIGFNFVDMHRLMITATQGSEERDSLLKKLHNSQNSEQNYLTDLFNGFISFYDKKYKESIQFFVEPVANNAFFGGSNIQRNIIKVTKNIALNKL